MKKKILSIALATMLGATMFAGCGAQEEAAPASEASAAEEAEAPAEEEAEAEAPAEETEEAGEATAEEALSGEGKSVTAIFFSLEGEYFTQFDGWLKDGLEAKGYTYTSQSCNFDGITMIEQIENAVASGTTALWVWPLDGKVVADALTAAREQGTIVYSFVQNPGEGAADMVRGTDEATAGEVIADMAIDWADKEYGEDAEDGSIRTIVLGIETSDNMKTRTDALVNKLAGDSRFDILEEVVVAGTTVDGQTAAENMFAKYGDTIDAIVTVDGATVLGVVAYLDSESSVASDPVKIGVFATEVDTELADYMKRGLYDGAAINGGNPYDNVQQQIKELDQLINGEIEGGFSAVDIGSCTIDNLADYGY